MEHHAHDTEIFCPANAALNLLNERWTLHIVRCLLGGTKRFNEVAREIGLNPATLRERLRALEDEGVLTRTVRGVMPPHVEYALTEKGQALNGIFEAVADWARTWMLPKGAELIDPPLDDSADLSACEQAARSPHPQPLPRAGRGESE